MPKENSWDIVESRPGFARMRSGQTFTLLPKEQRQRTDDLGCCCPYCSPDGKGSTAFPTWDTQTAGKDGRTYLVHMPEIDPERVKLRASWAPFSE